MKIEQMKLGEAGGFQGGSKLGASAHLVLLFGGTAILQKNAHLEQIKRAYPKALLLGCSTAGEICGIHVSDNSLVATAVQFEGSGIRGAQVDIQEPAESYLCGERLSDGLKGEALAHVLVLSDGIKVNGSQLVRGLRENLPAGVQITGGLSGDGARFQKTLVFLDSEPREGKIAALGFYGKRLKIGCGSLGGWDAFGPERQITRSKGNVLYELDGQPALRLYKKYLGEHSAGFPSTGLLFPLSVRSTEGGRRLVRTLLGVDENKQSMTFAGDVPEGDYARLMKANFDRLVDGAQEAAKSSRETIGASRPDLAVLISCVGRKLVLKQRTGEELEAVRSALGNKTVLTGFYSYGEICPTAPMRMPSCTIKR